MISGSFCSYFRGKIDDVDDNASDGKSFNYKTKIVGNAPERPEQPDPDQNGNQPPQPPVPALSFENTIQLKCPSNFGDLLICHW